MKTPKYNVTFSLICKDTKEKTELNNRGVLKDHLLSTCEGVPLKYDIKPLSVVTRLFID